MVFNPLEQERLSVVTLLVNTPRVRVLSEEGQPLSVQISVHWSSATDMVPDVYQVRQGTVLPACQYLSWGLTPHEHLPPPSAGPCLLPGLEAGGQGRGVVQRTITIGI